MQEIKCPNCGKMFQVDESGYAQILQQVRDDEFKKELERREQSIEEKKEKDVELARMEQEREHSNELSKKDKEIADKNSEIEKIKAELERANTEKELAVSEAIRENSKEYSETIREKEKEFSETIRKKEKELSDTVLEKDKEISEKGVEIAKLQDSIEMQKQQTELRENDITEKFKDEIRLREEEIERLKDFKAKQSTKMVGESLEQHCMNQFNQIRMTAFPNAYFEKDNDASSGSKGDFIFRESSDGTEFISIMFEMKNEVDETATKHKNEDFFKELDKDRNEKNCEYAVLVSLLESDNDFYNNGIVDVSYRYPKMFVIRPQFFIPLISLLRNAALNSLEYQKKLTEVQNQQLDIYNFESELDQFKTSFADSFRKAGDRFNEAIDSIDKAIANLQKVRERLTTSEKHLNTANRKLEDVNIKKLTKNSPSVKEMFDEMK